MTSMSWAMSGRHWVLFHPPSNPTGQILAPDVLAARVRTARARGAIVLSDECYGEFGWDVEPVSVLHPSICDGDYEGLLALHSLSKRSNLAGYRAGFVAGDDQLIAELFAVRKHAGMIVPGRTGNHDHLAVIRIMSRSSAPATWRAGPSSGRRWRRRASGSITGRRVPVPVGDPGRGFARVGRFPGPQGHPGGARRFLRGRRRSARTVLALTATDERIAAAASRLTG